jgi:hypothetical protein
LRRHLAAEPRLNSGVRRLLPLGFGKLPIEEQCRAMEAVGRAVVWGAREWTDAQLTAVARAVLLLASEVQHIEALYNGLMSGSAFDLWPAWPCLLRAFQNRRGLAIDCVQGAVLAGAWMDAYGMCQYIERRFVGRAKPHQGLLPLYLVQLVAQAPDVARQTLFCRQFVRVMRAEGRSIIEGWTGMRQVRLNRRRSLYNGLLDQLEASSKAAPPVVAR